MTDWSDGVCVVTENEGNTKPAAMASTTKTTSNSKRVNPRVARRPLGEERGAHNSDEKWSGIARIKGARNWLSRLNMDGFCSGKATASRGTGQGSSGTLRCTDKRAESSPDGDCRERAQGHTFKRDNLTRKTVGPAVARNPNDNDPHTSPNHPAPGRIWCLRTRESTQNVEISCSMKARPYDVAVIGLGVMGGAAALQLARRGLRVVGLDRYAPPHDKGSSHGRVRLIREAYYESPLYVPLVRRAFELWRKLEGEVGRPLMTRPGALMVGAPDSDIVKGTLASAMQHAIPHEVLSATQVTRRFPGLLPLDDMVGVLEPGAALLFAEQIVAAQIGLAERAGAELRTETVVERWEPVLGGFELHTSRGKLLTRRVVCCAGPWMPTLIPPSVLPLTVERQVQSWYTPQRLPELFRPDRCPTSMWQLPDGRYFYAMPDLGDGVKVGWHHSGNLTTAEGVARDVSPKEHASVADLLRRFLPHAKGERREHAVCLYANTPDGHFAVDTLPNDERVLVVSACSGHGFKFASAIGEAVAELVTTGKTSSDMRPFLLRRFARAASPTASSD